MAAYGTTTPLGTGVANGASGTPQGGLTPDANASQVMAANPGMSIAENAMGQPVINKPTTASQISSMFPSTNSGANATNSANSEQALINQMMAQNSAANANTQSILKSIQAMEQANAPGVAVGLDTNALNAQAQAAAQANVNPLYTQQLNSYLQGLGALTGTQDLSTLQGAISSGNYSGLNGTAEQQNALNIGQEQAGLGNTLAQNTLAQNQAAGTNALAQGNINAESQNYQLNSAQSQQTKLASIMGSIGSGNLGASGIGQQQLWQASLQKEIADAQQQGQFQYQRDTSNLSAQDTFAQLAQSSAYATTAEGQAETQTNFNLKNYLLQAAQNDQSYQQQLATSQQQAITTQTANEQAQLYQQAINAAVPVSSKNYAASEQAYNPILNSTQAGSLPTLPSYSDALNSLGVGSSV